MNLASLRVSGLDESVTKEMVAEAVVKANQCDAGALRVGEIVAGPAGMATLVLRCPIPSAKLKLLKQRPLRC